MDYSAINKELRLAARIIKFFGGTSVKKFRFLSWLGHFSNGKKLKGFDCDEFWIDRKNENSKIRIRTYRPKNNEKKLPALLYLHGGGYVIGSPEKSAGQFKPFLETRDCVVIAPDYRKSLDAPYPAALDDSYDTLVWIKENAEQLGISTDQIMVGGHSAGGGLTAAVCLYARDKKEVSISFQMPIYPMIDDRMTNPSAVNNTMPLWDSKTNKLGWQLYLKGLSEKGLDIPIYAAPSRANDYSNLPPTATFVGDIEPFYDETCIYVENIKKAGVPVEFEVYEGCYHGFDAVVPNSKVSRAAKEFLCRSFAYAVDNHFAAQK
jgi:acetyl esterase/lipase